MMSGTSNEEMLSIAIGAVKQRDSEGLAILDELAAPVYVTDAKGRLTFFNRACVEFSGRTPTAGKDRWCVSWKLFTSDGKALPKSRCPMAVAIKEKRAVRGVEAIAERPDGSRIRFQPFPTPLLDERGEIVGALNMLVDVTDRNQLRHLRSQAERCRRLARAVDDRPTKTTLVQMAAEYDEKARTLLN